MISQENDEWVKFQCQKKHLFESLQNLASEMGMQSVGEDPQKVSYSASGKSSFSFVLCMNVHKSELGVNLSILIKLSKCTNINQINAQGFTELFNSFNLSESKFLRVCYNQQEQMIVANTPKILFQHPKYIIMQLTRQIKVQLLKMVASLQKQFNIHSVRVNSEKLSKKINLLKVLIEKNRKKKTKSSKISLDFQDLEQYALKKIHQEYLLWKTSCEDRRKKRQEGSQQILRLIEILSSQKADTSISKGNFSQIETLKSEFKIFNCGSTNSKVNQQLQISLKQHEEEQHSLKMSNEASDVSEKNQQCYVVVRESYLVAKRIKQNMSEPLLNQINILNAIRQSRCPAINNFYCADDLEAINLGNAEVCLYSQYHQKDLYSKISKKKNILLIMQNLIQGMYLLEKKFILHRDLKPDNVLLCPKMQPKIIDFGSAYYSNNYKGSKKYLISELKTTRYYNLFYSQMPQEIKNSYNRYQFNTASLFDVYAFGIMIQNFLCNFDTKQQLGLFLYELINWLGQACTRINPEDRPQPIDIYIYLKHLTTFLAEYKNP